MLKIYDVELNLYKDGQHYDTVTDNFGKLALTLYLGKEYAGETAAVYQLHGKEIIPYKNLEVDEDGMVTTTVTELSAFGIA